MIMRLILCILLILLLFQCNGDDPINDPTGKKLKKYTSQCKKETMALLLYLYKKRMDDCSDINSEVRKKNPDFNTCSLIPESQITFILFTYGECNHAPEANL